MMKADYYRDDKRQGRESSFGRASDFKIARRNTDAARDFLPELTCMKRREEKTGGREGGREREREREREPVVVTLKRMMTWVDESLVFSAFPFL